MATAVVSFQWFFWGYSLAFSHTAGKFIGNLDNFGLMDVLGAPSVGSSRIPDLMFCVYQGMFAAITYVDLVTCAASIRANYVTVLLSLLEPWQSVVACFPASFTCLSGQRSSTTPSPAGPGTHLDGYSKWEDLTLPVAHPCILPLDLLPWLIHTCWASVAATVPRN